MALRFLERELRRELALLGREELMGVAVSGIGLTDDGGTIYVHPVSYTHLTLPTNYPV